MNSEKVPLERLATPPEPTVKTALSPNFLARSKAPEEMFMTETLLSNNGAVDCAESVPAETLMVPLNEFTVLAFPENSSDPAPTLVRVPFPPSEPPIDPVVMLREPFVTMVPPDRGTLTVVSAKFPPLPTVRLPPVIEDNVTPPVTIIVPPLSSEPLAIPATVTIPPERLVAF